MKRLGPLTEEELERASFRATLGADSIWRFWQAAIDAETKAEEIEHKRHCEAMLHHVANGGDYDKHYSSGAFVKDEWELPEEWLTDKAPAT